MKIAFLFPGQGSQYVGMGQDLFKKYKAAREVFLEVDDVLEEKLSTLIFEGNIDKLTLTKNAQPLLWLFLLLSWVMLHRGLDFEKLDIFAGHPQRVYRALCLWRPFIKRHHYYSATKRSCYAKGGRGR